MTDGQKGLGMIQLCSFEGILGRLWLPSGCGRGGETNDTTPPEDGEVWAHACASASDIDIL